MNRTQDACAMGQSDGQPATPEQRDFAVVDARVRAATGAAARIPGQGARILGQVEGRNLWQAHLGQPPGTGPAVLVIAGTHGDEPATVEASLQLLEGTAPVDLRGFSVDVLPCTNPLGHERDTRETGAGFDLNWSWHRDGVAEIDILKSWLADRRWEAVIDFHEDWETPGFYVYEHRLGVAAAGPRIVQAVAVGMDINRDREIEGWPACDGVVTADSSRERMDRGDGLPLVLLRDHTPHKLTTETPTSLPLPPRVRAHHAALQALLDHYREQHP